MNDAELLREYSSDKSEAAFQALVERHLPLVYSSALRQVRNPELAENLTLVVFILLARKCDQLSPEAILADWLFRTTQKVIAKGLRGDRCRLHCVSSIQGFPSPRPADVWVKAGPFLDAALIQLGERERGAVLLHYFQFRRLDEIGLAFGISEEIAQKKIARAICKLRKLLLRCGADLPVPVLPGLLMTRGAQAAPSELGPSVLAAALNQTALSTPVLTLLHRVDREPIWPKVNPVLQRAAALAVIIGLVVHFWPRQTFPDSSAYSFETRIVMRPPYVAPPLIPPVLGPPKALAASSADHPARTNGPVRSPQQVSAVQSQPPANNLVWAPGGTVVDLAPTAPSPGLSSVATPLISSPDLGLPAQPAVWRSPAPNVFRFSAGFSPIVTNNFTPWATVRRPMVIVPIRITPSPPPRKK